ncbi:MAG: ATP-binding protein, partial [Ilumatobacteraceae bacterium]
HVVFVLATTDPQKVSETIRSRTQHLQFHLLPMDVMESHIKWLAGDAGIDIDDAALQAVLRQGGGSARDTVSALELVASGGGSSLDSVPIDEFVEAFIEHDPGRALTVVAFAVQQGRDPRTLADDIVRHLRDCFLSLMAPELVQLPAQRAEEVARLAQRLGAAALVRAIERVGETLVEMRHAPDTRLLLEVALVQLTHEASSVDISTLLDRIERLEAQVASGAAAPARPAPVDPATGRAQLGGRARSSAPASAAPAPAPAAAPAPASPATAPAAAPAAESAPAPAAPVAAPAAPAPASPPSAPAPAPAPAPAAAGGGDPAARAAAVWTTEITPGLKGLSRAMFAATKLVGARDGAVVVAAPNDAHRQKCQQVVKELEALVQKAVGAAVPVHLVVDGAVALDDLPLSEQVAAPPAPPPTAAEEEEIDVAELVDVPPESVQTTDDKLLQAFPGSSFVDE